MSVEAGQIDSQPKQVLPFVSQDPSAVQWQPTQNPVLASRDIKNQV